MTQRVEVQIVGTVVRVDGGLVEHDGTGDIHEVAVHAVARQFATPLGRVVNVVARDESGLTLLHVHPDGHAEVPLPQQGR